MRTARKTPEQAPVFDPSTVPELLQELEQKDHIIEQRNPLIAEQQKLLKLLEEQLRLARQRRFGSSSEKPSFQGDFFDEAELEAALGDVEAQLPDDAPPRRPARSAKASPTSCRVSGLTCP